jgi:hypothetical protein
VTELEQIKGERDATMQFLNGLRNCPSTKRALKRHLYILEKQIEFLEGKINDLTALIHFSEETPLLEVESGETAMHDS